MTKSNDHTTKTHQEVPPPRPSAGTSWVPPRPTEEEFPDLHALAEHHGESTLDEALRLAARRTRAQHTKEGSGFATPRGTKDAVRIYGAATQFLAGADKDLRKMVKVSVDVLRIGVGVAYRADLRYALKSERVITKRTAKKVLTDLLDVETVEARALRDQFAKQLTDVAGDNTAFCTQIKTALAPAAAGKAETGPGVSLASLVTVARLMLKSTDDGIKDRRALFCLDEEFVTECELKATGARAVTKTAGTPKGMQNLNEGEVDLYDGLNLAIMQKVVDAFAAAHGRDKRVPKLAFVTLRTYVNRGKSVAKTAKKKAVSKKAAKKTATSTTPSGGGT